MRRVAGVEQAQLVELPVVDAVGEQRAGVLERRAPGGELVLEHPLPERLGDDGPAIADPRAVAQPRAVGVGRSPG